MTFDSMFDDIDTMEQSLKQTPLQIAYELNLQREAKEKCKALQPKDEVRFYIDEFFKTHVGFDEVQVRHPAIAQVHAHVRRWLEQIYDNDIELYWTKVFTACHLWIDEGIEKQQLGTLLTIFDGYCCVIDHCFANTLYNEVRARWSAMPDR
jgi:hypothetical protein